MQKGLKAKLESISSDKNNNLYAHLTEVLRNLLLENPTDAYTLFEQYSQRVKKGAASQSSSHADYSQILKELLPNVQKTLTLINKPNTGTEQQPAEPGPAGYVPNLIEEARWYQQVGIGLGEDTVFKLFKSLSRFVILKSIGQLRFWGKIFGTKHDYYIAEGPATAAEDPDLPPDVEPRGTGVNQLTYWVATDLNGDWTELPLVTPDQMRTSRKIRYLFTGELETPIVTNPFFFGKEKHLLKCQIVRMTNSCTLVPRTMYNVNPEEKKQINPQEEWKWPSFQTLSSVEGWVHHPLSILKNGRQAHLKPVIPEGSGDVDEDKLMKQIEAKDPFEERLKPISRDTHGGITAWKVVTAGDCNDYRAPGKLQEKINYGVIALKSNIWKGYTTVYHNKQVSSVYFGYGMKTSLSAFYPAAPQQVLTEAHDAAEQHEPNFPPEEPKKVDQEPAAVPADGNAD